MANWIANENTELSYFVEWRPTLWTPAVRWLLGNSKRFAGKRVLDLGCRYGRMSCLFGLLGATVQGVELEGVSLARAWQEADRWNLRGQVQFLNYEGNPLHLPGPNYDFVFTKSVLVTVPKLDAFLVNLSRKLNPRAELMFAENLAGGTCLNFMRRAIIHRREPNFHYQFHGVDQAFLASVSQKFDLIKFKKYYGVVAAIRAQMKAGN